MCEAILDFLNTGKMLKEINSTIVTLVPKGSSPKSVMDYKSISCCNVLYKGISKVLCERMKILLPAIIDENQSAFVHSRYIAYNIIICQDLVKQYGRKSMAPGCLIKLDIKKAYDTVEWEFIDEMIQALNFPNDFRKLVMTCLTTLAFSLMIKGHHMDSLNLPEG